MKAPGFSPQASERASTSWRRIQQLSVLGLAMLLGACATLAPDGDLAALEDLTRGKTAGVTARPASGVSAQAKQAIDDLLATPLTVEAAVRIALLNNPQLHASMATLGISDADRVQAGRPPNPHLAIGRFTEGAKVEIERWLKFDVLGLLALPWRAQWAGQQHELARLQAAQDIVRTAADTRRAWVRAVAAQQTARYLRDAKEAAEAGAELARRMTRVGNWSRLQQAREQSLLADATAQLARAEQAAFAAREQLTRWMGLWGTQTNYRLPERLPDIPKDLLLPSDIEAQALRERLDVRAAVMESRFVADSLGYTRAAGFVNALELGFARNTSFDNAHGERETSKGLELELPLPLFDWGQARNTRAQGIYLQSAARVRAVAVLARSEAREAYHGWRTAYDLARHHRDEILPLRKFINDEIVLRYNGMLVSVWELLGDVRVNMAAVVGSMEAQRDFWLAHTELHMVLTGTSPGGLLALQGAAPSAPSDSKGH